MKTLNGNPSRRPMKISMDTSLHNRPSFPQNTNNHLKHSSFCSHLIPEPTKEEEEDINGCATAIDDSDQISVFDAENYFKESSGEQQKENKIISTTVSSADQRFGFISTASRLSSVSSSIDGYGRNYRAHSFHATPTASSEASWNSQTGLLSKPPGSIGVSLRNLPSSSSHEERKKKGRSRKWFMGGGKCPCSGKKSVRVVEEKISASNTQFFSNRKKISESLKSEEISGNPEKLIPSFLPSNINLHHHHKPFPNSHQQGFGLLKERGGFSFPVLNQSSKLAPKGPSVGPIEDPPRDSLEVFQPHDELLTVSRRSMDVQQRPRPPPPHAGVDREIRRLMFPVSPVMSRVTATDDDDAGSDASSDLFEIESFSTQPTSSYPITYRRRDSLDEASTLNAIRRPNGTLLCCRHSLDEPATECYEPSEASIEWSVTTAEGFDRASVTNFSISASEIEYVRRMDKSGGGGGGRGGDERNIKRRSSMGNGLLSCRCEEAVSVGPQPVKYCVQQDEELEGPVVGGPPLSVPLPPISRTRHVK